MTSGRTEHLLRERRLAAQLLSGPPAGSPETVVERVLAVQAQDERGFRLAVRSRSAGLVAADVDRALTEGRLLVSWLNRGTLHLVRAEDYWWLHGLTAARGTSGTDRRLRQEGVDAEQAERGVGAIVGALEAEGPLSRHQLRHRLDAEGIPTQGQALVHLLVLTSRRGLIVRGPVVDGQHAFVAVERWLGKAPAPLGRDEALARLARRYLAGHGPAEPEDLATWAGITLADARRGVAELGPGWAATEGGWAATEGGAPTRAPTRLLGPFDPILHGWRGRELFTGGHRSVVTVNGIFRPVALDRGRVVATWGLASGTVTVRAFEPLSRSAAAALLADAQDVQRYLGLAVRPAVAVEG